MSNISPLIKDNFKEYIENFQNNRKILSSNVSDDITNIILSNITFNDTVIDNNITYIDGSISWNYWYQKKTNSQILSDFEILSILPIDYNINIITNDEKKAKNEAPNMIKKSKNICNELNKKIKHQNPNYDRTYYIKYHNGFDYNKDTNEFKSIDNKPEYNEIYKCYSLYINYKDSLKEQKYKSRRTKKETKEEIEYNLLYIQIIYIKNLDITEFQSSLLHYDNEKKINYLNNIGLLLFNRIIKYDRIKEKGFNIDNERFNIYPKLFYRNNIIENITNDLYICHNKYIEFFKNDENMYNENIKNDILHQVLINNSNEYKKWVDNIESDLMIIFRKYINSIIMYINYELKNNSYFNSKSTTIDLVIVGGDAMRRFGIGDKTKDIDCKIFYDSSSFDDKNLLIDFIIEKLSKVSIALSLKKDLIFYNDNKKFFNDDIYIEFIDNIINNLSYRLRYINKMMNVNVDLFTIDYRYKLYIKDFQFKLDNNIIKIPKFNIKYDLGILDIVLHDINHNVGVIKYNIDNESNIRVSYYSAIENDLLHYLDLEYLKNDLKKITYGDNINNTILRYANKKTSKDKIRYDLINNILNYGNNYFEILFQNTSFKKNLNKLNEYDMYFFNYLKNDDDIKDIDYTELVNLYKNIFNINYNYLKDNHNKFKLSYNLELLVDTTNNKYYNYNTTVKNRFINNINSVINNFKNKYIILVRKRKRSSQSKSSQLKSSQSKSSQLKTTQLKTTQLKTTQLKRTVKQKLIDKMTSIKI